METHLSEKYAASTLLASSAERGWSAISAELRSHQPSSMARSVPKHTEISLVIDGNRDCLITRSAAGQTQRAAPVTGTFWLSPIGISDNEATVTAPVSRSLHLCLPETLFDRLKDDFRLPIAPAHSVRLVSGMTDPIIQEIGISILSELNHETAAGQMYVETASLTLAARLIQKYCDSGSCTIVESDSHALDDSRLRRVLDYIASHVDDDISLANLADVVGYSRFHFAHKFTLAMGVSPHRYISRLRLEKAMAELAAGDLPLVEIALNAHFSSQASFTRAFRRATGMTPKEYRRRRF